MKRTSSFTFISHRQRHNDIICLVREEGRGQGMNGGYLASRARPFILLLLLLLLLFFLLTLSGKATVGACRAAVHS